MTKQQRIEELEEEIELLDEKWLATVETWLYSPACIDATAAIMFCLANPKAVQEANGSLSYQDSYMARNDPYYLSNNPNRPINPINYGYDRLTDRLTAPDPYAGQLLDPREAMDIYMRHAQRNQQDAKRYRDQARMVHASISSSVEDASVKAMI